MVIENKLWLEERLTSYFRMQGICSFKQSVERIWEPNQPEQQQKKKKPTTKQKQTHFFYPRAWIGQHILTETVNSGDAILSQGCNGLWSNCSGSIPCCLNK